jgi:hypothetical protein
MPTTGGTRKLALGVNPYQPQINLGLPPLLSVAARNPHAFVITFFVPSEVTSDAPAEMSEVTLPTSFFPFIEMITMPILTFLLTEIIAGYILARRDKYCVLL